MTLAAPRLALALFAMMAVPVAAQTVYRCGNEYTRVPCSNGKPVDVDERSLSARQAAEARRAADRERRLGDDMERSRLRKEAALKPAGPASISPKPPSPAASASLKPKKKAKGKIRIVDEKDFVAKVPKAGH